MVDEWRHVDKFERILHVPACYISRELATRMAERIRAIAEEQANVDYLDALRQMAPQLGLAPEDAVIQHGGNADLQRLLIVRRDRITFISPYGNVQYVGRDLAYEEIPVDPDQVIVDVTGNEGRYVNITLTTDVMRAFPLHRMNKILIQGMDQAWVNSLYQEFETALVGGKKVVRDLAYRGLKPLGFLAFLALSFLELRLFELARPDFTLLTPLGGLAIVAVFALLWINQFVVFSAGGRAIGYLYPYFELENRVSERRKDLRKWWAVTIIAVYGSGVWAVVSLLWK